VGLDGFNLLINSVGCPKCRPAFNELLREKLAEMAPRMCGDCQRRAVTNPLRVLDCKVPEDQPLIETLPSILDHLGPECREHFDFVKAHLTSRGIPFEVRPRMVRGLDYYTRTTFEVTHGALGAQNSVLGGGRYDGLAESIGSKVPAPGIGFSIGEDRLVMTVEQSVPLKEDPLVLVTFTAGDATQTAAADAAAQLRAAGIRVEVGQGKLKKVFEIANKLDARVAIVCGENEVAAGELSMKDMRSQEQVTFRRELLLERVNECLNKYR
jgi:histidyl-tRNA synthetase